MKRLPITFEIPRFAAIMRISNEDGTLYQMHHENARVGDILTKPKDVSPRGFVGPFRVVQVNNEGSGSDREIVFVTISDHPNAGDIADYVLRVRDGT